MKKKITKIWGVGLVIVLTASLLLMAAPVSAGTLSWGTETIPSDSGKVIQPGTDVFDLAVAGDGTTIYAAAPDASVATLEAVSPNTAAWDDTKQVSGSYSAKLGFTSGDNAYVEFVPETGITMADLATIGDTNFLYHMTGTGNVNMELRFLAPDCIDADDDTSTKRGHADVNVTVATPAIGSWTTEDAVDSTNVWSYFNNPNDGVGGAVPQGEATTLALILAAINADEVMTGDSSLADDWELTRVRLEIGWDSNARTCYIDDVTIDGTTYNLEIGDAGVVGDAGVALSGNIYKSTNAGETWSGLTNPDDSSVGLVAVAPDDEDLVAIVASPRVYVSTNGGSSWGALTAPSSSWDVINDIAISPESAGNHFIALAATGDGAEVWHYEVGAVGAAWKLTSDTMGDFGDEFKSGDTAGAVAFSPNFASDQVMVAVTAKKYVGSTELANVLFQIFSFNKKRWNDDSGISNDYPVNLIDSDDAGDETDAGLDALQSASISLAQDYLGSDDAMRLAFVGLSVSVTGTSGDTSSIQRLDDVDAKVLKEGVQVHSIAFDGTNLVAGRYDGDSATVYRSADPLASSPSVKGSDSLKSPGGVDKVVVAWAGEDVVAGTSGDESAFAVSRDNGKSFNDVSLIDTAIFTLEDVAVSADGSKVYLATDDADGSFSLWRQASSWERVLSLQDVGESSFIVRLAPDDPDVVYVAEEGGSTLYYTTTGGSEKWFSRVCRYTIQDLAVESNSVAYVGCEGARVSKTRNSGFTWGSSESTSLAGGDVATVTSLGEDLLIVGSTKGYVSYSTNGNSSWTKISKVTGSGAAQVTASGLDDGDFIYASTNKAEVEKAIYRWEIGESTSWDKIREEATTTPQKYVPVYGIALQDGALYVLATNELYLTLDPTASTVSWSTKAADDGVEFTATPSALRVSTASSTKLWAIDTVGADLYSYIDTLALATPALVAPAHGAEIAINPVSGSSYDVSFTWERPSKATAYQLQIALDYDFNEIVEDIDKDESGDAIIASTKSTVAYIVGPGGKTDLEYMPETTYYWKVRASEPIYSPWSAIRMFTIGALPEIQPPVQIVIPPAPPAPQLVLPPTPAPVQAPDIIFETPPPPPDIIIPPAPAPPAPITPAFIWAIVIIGAILVIAVVVLIVRTRRVA